MQHWATNAPPSSDVLTGVSQIAAGFTHTCALMASTGGVRCWGQTTASNSVLVPPITDVLTGVAEISAGDAHTCAVMASNSHVRCWGDNNYGEVGNGATSYKYALPTADVHQS